MDSGTTGHFMLLHSKACINIQPSTKPINVRLPNGKTITSTHTGELPLPNLPMAARKAHLFPELSQHSLISVAQLADAGCSTIFDSSCVQVHHNGNIILTGSRTSNGLWSIDFQQSQDSSSDRQANSIIESSSQEQLIQYLHATCFSPSPSTWIRAINAGHFSSWPNLTTENVRKYLQPSIATSKGHMDQRRKNIQSTKASTISPANDDDDFTAHPTCTDGKRSHFVYAALLEVPTVTGKIYSDLTGRFPIQSSTGNKYIMVVYDYDSNYIHAIPLRNRTDAEMLRGYDTAHATLTSHGLRPQLQILDNEASHALKSRIKANESSYQLVPPAVHRANAAERAIRTFKNHFIAGLSSVDPNFPLYLWDRLIEQALLTLNLMRTSRINPKLSAQAQLHGFFDFNRTPLAPPGTRILAHEKPSKRASWAPHGEDGWYIGPAPEHYRCYRVYIPKTRATRIVDTIEFFPHNSKMPHLSSADAAMRAAKDLTKALRNPHPATPFINIGDAQMEALSKLAEIFNAALPISKQTKATRVENAIVLTPQPPRVTTAHSYNTRSKQVANAAQTTTPLLPNKQIQHTVEMPKPSTPNTPLEEMFQQAPDPHCIPTAYANSVINPATGKVMEYRELITTASTKEKWLHSAANEFGRLAQGIRDIAGTDTIRFIQVSDMPKGRTATYARFVCTLRPQKDEVERTRLTVGGNLINYPGDVSTRTADLTTFKCLVNNVLSKPKAKFGVIDIKNFYLNTPMERPEYMRIPIELIPPEIVAAYNLLGLVHNGFIYVEINKGMYGLPQAGIIANKLLAKRLAPHGYFQSPYTPGLWKHTYRPIQFSLVVDDFGVDYENFENAQHLHNALKQYYECNTDWEGKLYCGVTLDWDYNNRTCDMSMPNYVANALTKFQHPVPHRPQHSPYQANIPQYGATVQLTDPVDDTPVISKDRKKRIQSIVGTFLFYARAVDPTMAVALSTLASEQSNATEKVDKAINQFLDYCATHPHATIRYHASDMQLRIHSDTSYLNAPKARSRVGGHHYLGNTNDDDDFHNGPILNPTGTLRHVVSSAAEAEVGGLFVNAKEGEVLRQTLRDIGWPQSATPIQTDNTTALGIANDTIRQQRSRAMDMRFYWVRDRVEQKHFRVYWAPGALNLADYFTKHHTAAHHQRIRHKYLKPPHH